MRNMSSGRFGLAGSFGLAAGFGGSIGVSVVLSTANDLRDLRGKSQCLGGAGKIGIGLSADVCWSSARNGASVVSIVGSVLGAGAGGYYAIPRTGLTVLERDSWETSLARGIWNRLLARRRRR